MPLSVPLVLIPGHPDRFYTVHVHRVRWNVGAVSVPLAADHLTALGTNAERGLRMVSECIAAELEAADVEVIEIPDGSAEGGHPWPRPGRCCPHERRRGRTGRRHRRAALAPSADGK